MTFVGSRYFGLREFLPPLKMVSEILFYNYVVLILKEIETFSWAPKSDSRLCVYCDE